MKTAILTAAASLALSVGLLSCKKNSANEDATGGAPQPITVLQSSAWTVAGAQALPKRQGPLGGEFKTIAFTTQEPGVLRWYTWFRDASSYSDQNELTVDAQGRSAAVKTTSGQAFGGEIKTVFGADTWKVNRSFDQAGVINVFRNDALVNHQENLAHYPSINYLQPAEDGLLTTTDGSVSNHVGFYSYASRQWKRYYFTGNNFSAIRHNGRTYVVTFSAGLAENEIKILGSAATPAPSSETMTQLASVPYTAAANNLYATAYGDKVFVVLHTNSSNRFLVYRVDLTALTAVKILDQPAAVPVSLQHPGIRYNWTHIEVDEAGNLYVAENRVSNTDPHWSIRKYAAAGGSSVILSEADLLPGTALHALKFVNGRLHVAIGYVQEIADGNPNDYVFDKVYHLQIIRTR